MTSVRALSPIVLLVLATALSTRGVSAEPRSSGTAPFTSTNHKEPTSCRMPTADAEWLNRALRAWEVVREQDLKLAPVEPPEVITFDRDCVYTVPPARPAVWSARTYDRFILLPDGKPLPAGVVSFAATVGGSSKGFFVMSLPSVWKAGGVSSTLGLEVLMQGVFVHEIMHTRQFYFVNPRLAELTQRYHLPDDLSDDSLQDHFASHPAYVKDYEAERDLLFAAAAAPDDVTARKLASQALNLMQTRRARWFIADEAKWLPLDDIFLTMEGLGQWAGLRSVINEGHGKLDDRETLKEWRRGGRYWTQDEGLAIFLTVDRLYPGWQTKAFAPQPALAEELLRLATHLPPPTA